MILKFIAVQRKKSSKAGNWEHSVFLWGQQRSFQMALKSGFPTLWVFTWRSLLYGCVFCIASYTIFTFPPLLQTSPPVCLLVLPAEPSSLHLSDLLTPSQSERYCVLLSWHILKALWRCFLLLLHHVGEGLLLTNRLPVNKEMSDCPEAPVTLSLTQEAMIFSVHQQGWFFSRVPESNNDIFSAIRAKQGWSMWHGVHMNQMLVTLVTPCDSQLEASQGVKNSWGTELRALFLPSSSTTDCFSLRSNNKRGQI